MNAVSELQIIEDFVRKPVEYRASALELGYRSYDFGHCVFHGIAVPGGDEVARFFQYATGLTPDLTFFRKSPLGQVEPNFIHTDIDMGEWSAILYLNLNPPEGDGTNFWTHKGTGAIESFIPHERSIEGRNPEGWILREHIAAKFNRLVMFPSSYFHSRALFDNWSEDGDDRLTQVVFGKGKL